MSPQAKVIRPCEPARIMDLLRVKYTVVMMGGKPHEARDAR